MRNLKSYSLSPVAQDSPELESGRWNNIDRRSNTYDQKPN